MSKRTVVLVAWSLWLATLANCAAGIVVATVVTRPVSLAVLAHQAVGTVLVVSVTTIGLVLALRRPTNPIGWLYATAGLVGSLTNPWSLWVDQLIRTGRPLPLVGQVAAVVKEFEWAPTVALVVTLPFLLVPDGRLRSPRWRVAAAASMIAAIIVPLAGSLVPGQLVQTPIANPFGLRGMPGAVATVVAYTCVALYWGSLVAALVCVVLRFRDARGIERQQLRWVAVGAAAAVIGLVLTTLVVHGILPWVAGPVAYAAVLAMPISVAVAILRSGCMTWTTSSAARWCMGC